MSFNPDKEFMLFKNVENSTNFNFHFDGKLIPLTSDHKHLVCVGKDWKSGDNSSCLQL
jgi:hypothetical protein